MERRDRLGSLQVLNDKVPRVVALAGVGYETLMPRHKTTAA